MDFSLQWSATPVLLLLSRVVAYAAVWKMCLCERGSKFEICASGARAFCRYRLCGMRGCGGNPLSYLCPRSPLIAPHEPVTITLARGQAGSRPQTCEQQHGQTRPCTLPSSEKLMYLLRISALALVAQLGTGEEGERQNRRLPRETRRSSCCYYPPTILSRTLDAFRQATHK